MARAAKQSLAAKGQDQARGTGSLQAPRQLDVKATFSLKAEDASYLLSLELPESIESVMLQVRGGGDVGWDAARVDQPPSRT